MPPIIVGLLVCTAIITYADFKWMIIPNTVNLALFMGGLALWLPVGLWRMFVAFCSGLAVFSCVWFVRHIHRQATGRLGLGLGDVKLIAVAAIWLPSVLLPAFIFIASLSALAFGVVTNGRNSDWTKRMPFGPFLMGSLDATWAFQHQLILLLGFK